MFTKYFLIALGFCGMSYAQQEKDSIKIISLNEIIVTGNKIKPTLRIKTIIKKGLFNLKIFPTYLLTSTVFR